MLISGLLAVVVNNAGVISAALEIQLKLSSAKRWKQHPLFFTEFEKWLDLLFFQVSRLFPSFLVDNDADADADADELDADVGVDVDLLEIRIAVRFY